MVLKIIESKKFEDGTVLEMWSEDCQFAGYKPVKDLICITHLTPDAISDEPGEEAYNCNFSEYHADMATAVLAFKDRLDRYEATKRFPCSVYAKHISEFLERN